MKSLPLHPTGSPPARISVLLILFYSLLVSSLIGPALSADLPPDDCEPKDCGGGLNISYPFWIEGLQPDYCGYPAYKLVCKDKAPVIDIYYEIYRVRHVFYDNRSFILSSVKLSSNICLVPEYNLSQSMNVRPFRVSPINGNLSFFLGCTGNVSDYTMLPCAVGGGGRHSFVGRSHPTPDEEMTGACESSVVFPFLDDGGAGGDDYKTLLQHGFLLSWDAVDCSECGNSGGRCRYDTTDSRFSCLCGDRPHMASCPGHGAKRIQRRKSKIILGITLGASGFLLACITLCCYHYKKNSSFILVLAVKSRNSHNVEAFLEQYGSSIPKRYGYSEVKKMTRSFSDKLGQGGYGTVFKGKLPDDKLVAVKVLNKSNENGEEFINEVASIGRTHHINIVRLLGFCYERSKRALIYEFMPNGSLDKFIFLKESKKMAHLGWVKLHEIAIGIARGLEYLHRGCNTRIVHFDIKPHNILLDEDFCPKISNFGLAKSCRPKQSILSTVGARGTIGYIAPEVFSRTFGVISSKSDVYSYGMMVLEMVGGRKNADARVDNTSEVYFPHWIYEHFNEIGVLELYGITSETEEVARKMILVGLWCTQTSPSSRPPISKVVEMLEGNVDDLQMPPKPYLSSP